MPLKAIKLFIGRCKADLDIHYLLSMELNSMLTRVNITLKLSALCMNTSYK